MRIPIVDKMHNFSFRILLPALVLIILGGCGPYFFYPEKEHYFNPAVAMFPHRDIYFMTRDGVRLHGWLFPSDSDKGTILVLHGNAENISTHVNSVLWLVPAGYNIFIIDYRGFGRSEGRPSIKKLQLDAEAGLRTLFDMEGINTSRVFVLGQSIGGATAVAAVARSPYKGCIKALIIDSAFADYRLILREKLSQIWITWPLQYPLSLTVNNDFSPIKWISHISPVPLLIMHGDKDRVVPIHHSLMLYESAKEPKTFWQISVPGHVASFSDAGVRSRFLEYIERL